MKGIIHITGLTIAILAMLVADVAAMSISVYVPSTTVALTNDVPPC